MSRQAVIRLYIAFQFFFGLLLWIPVFYEVQKRLGLSDQEIFGIQSIYYVVFCFLEIPTGMFADRFGYRASVRWGAGILVLANVLPRLAPDYHGFLAHFLLIALSRSMISGAASAYLYEYLKAEGHVELYKKTEGDARFWGLAGKVVCWTFVGYLMKLSPFLPYDLSALSAVISLGLAWWLPHFVVSAPEKSGKTQALIGGHVGEALRLGFTNPLIVLIILQGIGIFVTVRVLQVNLYQPILKGRAFSVESFGWIMSLMTVFEALGSRWAPRVQKHLPDRLAVTTMTLVIGVAVLVIALTGQAGVLGGLCLFSLAAGMAFPIQRQVLNDAIPAARYRATLLSLESIVDRAVCAVAVLPLGTLVAQGALDITLIWCAIAVMATALLVQWGIQRYGERRALSVEGIDASP